MKQPHPATVFKRNYKDVVIPPIDNKNEIIGRRTGKPLDERFANGNDFLLKDDLVNFGENKKNIMDLYYSDSDSSKSGEDLSDSSSEAVESSFDESSVKKESNKNNISQKNNNVTQSQAKGSNFQAIKDKFTNKTEKENLKIIDLDNESDEDESSEEEPYELSSPTFNKKKSQIKNEKSVNNTKEKENNNIKTVASSNNIKYKNNIKSESSDVENEYQPDLELSFAKSNKVKFSFNI
jgi:hypothetical protein